MKTRSIRYLKLILLSLAASSVNAETLDCRAITSLPYVIDKAGSYCFVKNLSTNISTGDAITITANSVTIDLNGWKLTGRAGKSTLAKGIFAYGRRNITIKNGNIRGFRLAIHFEDASPYEISQGHLIEDIRVEKNTLQGFWIDGTNNIVRRNRIFTTGGGTAEGIITIAHGVIMRGPYGRFVENDVIGVTATAAFDGFGLLATSADGTVIEGNRIGQVAAESGTAYGIRIVDSDDVLIRSNSITTADNGIDFQNSTGKYTDNLTSNVTTPYTGGTAVGTND